MHTFRTKEEEKPYGKGKNTVEKKDAGKKTERDKVHWEGRSCPADQASNRD
jgi:hypothetical protein